MKSTITYNPKEQSISWAQQIHNEGNVLLCPKCGAELIVALTLEEANHSKVHPGIFCPNNSDHVFETVNLVSARDAMSWFRKNDE
jgi:hypothetical protein